MIFTLPLSLSLKGGKVILALLVHVVDFLELIDRRVLMLTGYCVLPSGTEHMPWAAVVQIGPFYTSSPSEYSPSSAINLGWA